MNTGSAGKAGSAPIKRIAIIGDGLEAWLAVNYLLAALGGKRIEMVVCGVPGSARLDGLNAVIPARANLSAIGLSDKVLARTCGASFSLGTQFAGQLKPYGSFGLDYLGLPFHHHWLRTNPQDSSDYFNWSPAMLAMQRGLFAPPVKRNEIGTLRHGMAYHVDIGKFTRLLRERATRHGVKVTAGSLASVDRESGSDRIVSLTSSRAETITTDLYVDCSGAQRALINGAASKRWIPAPQMPGFYIAAGQRQSSGAPAPYHRLSFDPHGWTLEVPTPDQVYTVNMSTTQPTEDSMEFLPGHFEKPWIENCVALGSAAATFLPVEPMHTQYLLSSLNWVVDLLPGRDCAAKETEEYNQLVTADLGEIYDLAALYELGRVKGSLQSLDPVEGGIHDSLRSRFKLFRRRGWIAPVDSDFLTPADWISAFILLGAVPARYDPLAERLSLDALQSGLQKLKLQIEKTATEFPLHRDYLRAIKSTPAVAPGGK